MQDIQGIGDHPNWLLGLDAEGKKPNKHDSAMTVSSCGLQLAAAPLDADGLDTFVVSKAGRASLGLHWPGLKGWLPAVLIPLVPQSP